MLVAIILLVVAFAWDIIAGLWDASQTVVGIKKGAGVEGNSIIKAVFSDKPSGVQLDTYNMTQTLVFTGIAVAGLLTGPTWALVGGGIGALLASGGRHIVGGKNWEYLMKGGNPDPNQTALQKFVGLLSWNEDKK